LVQTVNMGSAMTNRLATIATRQRQSRTRDVLFAVFIALATVVSMSSVAVAADAASTTHVATR
jgi:hypothetical protein